MGRLVEAAVAAGKTAAGLRLDILPFEMDTQSLEAAVFVVVQRTPWVEAEGLVVPQSQSVAAGMIAAA